MDYEDEFYDDAWLILKAEIDIRKEYLKEHNSDNTQCLDEINLLKRIASNNECVWNGNSRMGAELPTYAKDK